LLSLVAQQLETACWLYWHETCS